MARPAHDPNAVPTRERILVAAHDAFASHGFARATLADIGRRAGLRRPSVLHHFPSKDALYAAVVARSFGALGSDLAAAMAEPASFLQRIDLLVQRLQGFLAAHPGTARIIMRELLDEGPGQLILTEQVAPVLDAVVAFIEAEGRGHLRPDVPVRAAVLQAASAILLYDATPVRAELWAGPAHAERLARSLFLPLEAT